MISIEIDKSRRPILHFVAAAAAVDYAKLDDNGVS